MKAASILLSALFTGFTAQSLGLLLLQRLRPRFTRQEQYLYAFVSGSAVLSLLVFLVAAAHLVWPATFLCIGVAAIGVCVWRKAYIPVAERFEPLPRLYLLLLWGTMLGYGIWAFMNALAPEGSSDGSMYHLGLVQRYMDQHGFGRITTSMYANLPLGAEMLFLFAFSLGRHSAAALVHFQFYVVLPLLMVAVGRRFGYPKAGVTAAIIVFLSPIFVFDGSSAYVDVAMACVVFSLFAVLQTWDETRDAALLPLIGLLAGFSYATKMTAFVAIPYAVLFVFIKLLRRREDVLRPMVIVCSCIAVMVGPWLLKDAITVGNPFSPFANRFFPNPYIRISFEQSYREYHRTYEGLKSLWHIPYETAVRGGVLGGLLGPVFLLAPLGLLSLRWKLGRQALLAATLFASTYPNNIGTRFLMGAAPFLAVAIAMAVVQWRAMAPVLILFHALISTPDGMMTYVDPYAWRLDGFYWRAAFRLQPESEYLNERNSEYAPAKLAERLVPKGEKIFTTGGIAHAYCRREVVVAYESALGNTLGDILACPLHPFYQPGSWWTYTFPEQSVRRLRLVLREGSKDIWSVTELRLLGPDGEIPRGPGWRLRAHPNPWEVQLAFDNCPVTKWMAAESSKPGMSVEVELDKPVQLIGVRAEATLDQPGGSARLEVEEDGRWKTLVENPTVTKSPPLSGLRRLATEDIKRYGFTYVAVSKGDFATEDIVKDPAAWGLTKVGEAGSLKLYKID
jgi:hypothetical protein